MKGRNKNNWSYKAIVNRIRALILKDGLDVGIDISNGMSISIYSKNVSND
jgi:hypothetical protein